jgi:hypothetical protein
MRLSRSIALLTETQQLDDRIRFVIKQLKLPVYEPGQNAPDAEAAAIDALAGEEAGPARRRLGRRRSKTKQEWMEWIASLAPADPSGDKGKFLQWITKRVLEGNLTFPEDIEKTKEELAKFDQMTKSTKFVGNRDIFSYATFADLCDVVTKNAKSEDVKIKPSDHLFGFKGVEVLSGPSPVRDVIYDNDLKRRVDRGPLGVARIVKVTDPEAGNRLFRRGGVRWCVKDPSFFNGSSYAPPYYMVELMKAPDGDEFLPVYLHDRKSFSLKNAKDEDANLNDMRPYGQLLKDAGLLDDKRGLQYVLTNGANVKEAQPLAYLSVITSDNAELKRQAVEYIESKVAQIRNRRA